MVSVNFLKRKGAWHVLETTGGQRDWRGEQGKEERGR